MRNLVFLWFGTFILFSCGGGGEGATPSSTQTPTTVNTDSNQVVTTGDLVASEDFTFDSDYSIDIVIPAVSINNFYFINICSDFNGLNINYNSCKIRTFLKDYSQNYTLKLSSSETNLIAQIWPIEVNAKPRTYYFEKNASSSEWLLTF